MAQKLVLTFNTAAGHTLQYSIDDPVENLTLDAVKASADKMIPVLVSNSGLRAESLKSAEYTTTSVVKIE